MGHVWENGYYSGGNYYRYHVTCDMFLTKGENGLVPNK